MSNLNLLSALLTGLHNCYM